jgi:hypothetical protein
MITQKMVLLVDLLYVSRSKVAKMEYAIWLNKKGIDSTTLRKILFSQRI